MPFSFMTLLLSDSYFAILQGATFLPENHVQSIRSAAFVSGPGLPLFLIPPSLIGISLHPRSVQGLTPARPGRLREQPMAKNFTSVFGCDESLPVQGNCTTYRSRPSPRRESLTAVLLSLQILFLEKPHRDPSKMLLGNSLRHDSSPVSL
jgi:hypothetical protein